MDYFNVSAKSGTCGNIISRHNKRKCLLAIFIMNGRKEHAITLKSHHLPWRKIDYGYKRLAHKCFGLIPFMYSREDLAVLTCPVIKSEP